MTKYIWVWLALILTWATSTIIAIEHIVPTGMDPNEPFRLTVRVPDQADYQIKCFYRFNSEEEFRVTNLEKKATRLYQVTLPIDKSINNVDYYFWIYKYNKFQSTLPKQNPVGQPYSVLNNLSELVYFEILSPDLANKITNLNHLTLMIRNNFPSIVTLQSAYLNDDEPLKTVKKKKSIIIMQNKYPLRQGKNRLTLVGSRNDGSLIKQTIRFKTMRQREKASNKSGEVRLNHLAYNTDKTGTSFHDPLEMTYSTKVNIDYHLADIELYGLYDSRDSDYTQPYSRYKATITGLRNIWQLQTGDIQQRYTPLTLNSRRIRGVKTDIDFLKLINSRQNLRLSLIAGQSNEAISISSGNVTNGTFEQETIGGQLLFSTMSFKSSVQYFKIKDVKNSVTSENIGTTKPIENHILGLFLQLRPSPLILVENETVGAAYYSDSRAATINISELNIDENLQSLIEPNLAIKTSLTAGYANKFTTQFPLFSRNRIFKFTHDYIHPSFVNTLNSSVESDKQQFTFNLSQKLLKKKLALSGQFKNKQNNLLNTLSATTQTNAYRLGVNYRTTKHGVINSSLMMTRRDQRVTTSNASIDNQLNYALIGWTAIPINNKGSKIQLNLNFSISEYVDYLSNQNNSDTTSYAASINSNYKQSKLVFGVNKSAVKSISSGTTNYLTINSTLRRSFWETAGIVVKLKTTFGINSNSGYEQNSVKLINSWDYTFKRKQWFSFPNAAFHYGLDLIKMIDSKDSDNDSLNFYETYFRFKVINSF